MKTNKWLFLWIAAIIILASCSANSGFDSANEAEMVTEESMSRDMASDEGKVAFTEGEMIEGEKEFLQASKRMIIYQASLGLEVENYEVAMESIEKKANEYGGYIVESSTYRTEDDRYSGFVTARIPQEKFQDFLNDAEGMAVKVYDRSVNGEDVTEEYVDLESRLKSKRVVEERLLSFMEQAEKTEDLLKISSDLAKVQEEIEQIVGRMKYLENQSSFSTVTISLHEEDIPNLENQNLNTWDRTKKQFVSSINALLSFGSSLVVVVIGNIPILILLAILVIPVLVYVKRRRQRHLNRNE